MGNAVSRLQHSLGERWPGGRAERGGGEHSPQAADGSTAATRGARQPPPRVTLLHLRGCQLLRAAEPRPARPLTRNQLSRGAAGTHRCHSCEVRTIRERRFSATVTIGRISAENEKVRSFSNWIPIAPDKKAQIHSSVFLLSHPFHISFTSSQDRQKLVVDII